MKTQQEIEKLAEQYVWGKIFLTKKDKYQTEIAYMSGYKQCQQDIGFGNKKMYSEEELKSAFKIGFNIGYGSPVSELDLKEEHCTKWFEQFKKK